MDTNIIQISFLLAVITGVVLLLLLLLINLMLNSRNSRLRHQSEMQQVQSQLREAVAAVKVEVAEATLGDVSRDLHDEVGQLLTFSILQLENISAQPTSEQPQMISEIKQSVRDAMESIRRISKGLSPDFINQQGLEKSVEQLLERAKTRTGIKTSMQVSPGFHLAHASNQVIVFRIIRECLTNAVKHGKASRINVGFSSSNTRAEVSFFDNGVGTSLIPDYSASLGWKNIKYYASLMKGEVAFDSAPEKGTEIIISIPNYTE